jgi:hypothetical protein
MDDAHPGLEVGTKPVYYPVRGQNASAVKNPRLHKIRDTLTDPDGALHFNEQENQDLMIMAVLDCGDLCNTSCAMQAFQLWYLAAHPQSFPESEPIFAEAKKVFPPISGLSHSEQVAYGAQFLREHCP